MIQFTPTEQRIFKILEDGMPHLREDLYPCIEDQLADMPVVLNVHIGRMRRKLETIGQDILCILRHRKIGYQQVRLLSSSVDGRT